MDVTPLVKKGQQIIQSYSGGRFKVNGAVYEGAVLVTPDNTLIWKIGAIKSINSLQYDDFQSVLDIIADLDVVLLGGGARMEFIAPDLRKQLKEGGVSVDVMDTGAACRTYNVLMAEGRRVACLALPYV